MSDKKEELKAELADLISDRPLTVEFEVVHDTPRTKITFYITKEQSEDVLDAFLDSHYKKQTELLNVLGKYNNNYIAAAKELGCSVKELQKKLKDYGIVS